MPLTLSALCTTASRIQTAPSCRRKAAPGTRSGRTRTFRATARPPDGSKLVGGDSRPRDRRTNRATRLGGSRARDEALADPGRGTDEYKRAGARQPLAAPDAGAHQPGFAAEGLGAPR